jgi:hypothetical protein
MSKLLYKKHYYPIRCSGSDIFYFFILENEQKTRDRKASDSLNFRLQNVDLLL